MRCVECHQETETTPCAACGREPRVGGRYALLQRVGGGSSGVVFRATDVQTGDAVAVKEVMLGGLDTDKARQLATREAAVLRQLTHPGIPGWRDEVTVGIGRSASLYLVQDFVDGQDLQAGLASRRWSEREVLSMMVEVLDILDYLHTRHPPVVHRDVKPANLIRHTDGRLVLVDFGAVRDALRTAGTGGSTVAGTFGYMAPEQFVGHAVPATDLFALGMTAVTLLSREEPAGLFDRAGRLDWERVVSVSPGATALLRTLLEADPDARPRAAAVVRRRVQALLDGRDVFPTPLRPSTTPAAPSSPTAAHEPSASPVAAPVHDRSPGLFAPDLDNHDLVPAGATTGSDLADRTDPPGPTRVVGLALLKAGLVALPLLLAGLIVTWTLFVSEPSPSTIPAPSVPEAPVSRGPETKTPIPAQTTLCNYAGSDRAFLSHPDRIEEPFKARPFLRDPVFFTPPGARDFGEALCKTQLYFDEAGGIEGALIEHDGCAPAYWDAMCSMFHDVQRQPHPAGVPVKVTLPVRFKPTP